MQKLVNILYKKLIMEGQKEDLTIELLRSLIKDTEFENKSFIAGGYVRDEILGKPSKDIDIVVELPSGGIAFADFITKKLNIFKKGSNPTIFPTFGTAKFNLRGIKYKGVDLSDQDIECVMTRKEQYHEKNRKPDVSPGTLKDDVERRDFTVNSLLKNLSTGEIVDLTGMGREDIKKGIIRTPLDPDIIFKDDPLRILRAIRFSCKYNWKLPRFMLMAIKKNAPMIQYISKERIQDELNKIMISPNPVRGIRLIQWSGLSKYIIPELNALVGLEQNKYHKKDAYKHTLDVLSNVPPNLITRLQALFHDIGKSKTKEVIDQSIHFYRHEELGANMTRDILKKLKYPKEIIDAVAKGVEHHMRLKSSGKEGKDISDKALRKLKRDLGAHIASILDLVHADNVSHSDEHSMPLQIPGIRNRLKTLKDIPLQQHIKLPLSGIELIQIFNLKPGKFLGDIKRYLEDQYLENPDMTKEQAIKLVSDKLKKLKI